MTKLRKKVFWTLYSSTCTVIFITFLIYNISNYFNTREMLHDAARSMFVDPRYANFIIQGFLNNLTSSLILLVIIFVILYFIVKIISEWIVRPTEEAFKKQKDFIADASHELKTPLSVIIASSDALAKNPQETKWIKNIQEESSRMNSLISKLLDLASTEKTNKEFQTRGNLSKTVELTALTFEGRAIEKNCHIHIDIESNITFIYNEDDIKQLVEILLDNAIKHSFTNKEIQLSLKKSGAIIMTVMNEGESILPGDEEKIFERFYRTDKVRDTKEKRYGLGLAIAKNITENHSGKISAKSDNEKTIFEVVFK